MLASDVIAAQFNPGFSRDLTYWRVYISHDRRLRQEVVVYNEESEFHRQLLRFWARLSRADMAGLWEIVERIGFREFERHYTHQTMIVTDCPTYRIAVRIGDRPKEVEAYDLYRLAEGERQPAMMRFQELWEAIHRHAPYGKVPMREGLPKPWWRFW